MLVALPIRWQNMACPCACWEWRKSSRRKGWLSMRYAGLWPRTPIRTAALQMIPGADMGGSRTEAIVADAAIWILSQPSSLTGNFFIDEDVHQQSGMTLEEVGKK